MKFFKFLTIKYSASILIISSYWKMKTFFFFIKITVLEFNNIIENKITSFAKNNKQISINIIVCTWFIYGIVNMLIKDF